MHFVITIIYHNNWHSQLNIYSQGALMHLYFLICCIRGRRYLSNDTWEYSIFIVQYPVIQTVRTCHGDVGGTRKGCRYLRGRVWIGGYTGGEVWGRGMRVCCGWCYYEVVMTTRWGTDTPWMRGMLGRYCIRAGNEPSRSLKIHNHREDPYWC